MAKIFKGDVNFGFVINQTGAQPLDSRSVVQSYTELLKAETFGTAIYNGMTVATIDEQKVYMLVDKTKATVADGWKEIGAGGAVSVETYAEAVALASDENIGQVIYVKTKSSYDADGEGEGTAVEYDAAPYIVIGAGSLQKLAASTASGDIEGDVAELTTRVSGLETAIGDDASGLVKDVKDLKAAVEDLPITFTRTKVGDDDSLVLKYEDGVVIGSIPVADFVADGMLESVTPEEGTNNFIFKFKAGNGTTQEFKVDFSKYVDTYYADNVTLELDSRNNTFKVKNNVFDTYGSASAVQGILDSYRTTNDTAVAKKVEQSTYDKEVEALEEAINAKANASDLNSYATIESVNDSLALKADKNDFDTLVEKVGHEATADASATGLVADIASLSVELFAKASSNDLTKGLATKLDASVKVNGVSFVDGKATLDAGDIALKAAITSDNGEGGSVEQYPDSTSVQSVLQSLNDRITAAVSNGLTSVVAGNGITVTDIVENTQTVSINKSELVDNVLTFDEKNALYVSDMRSYWEAI